jgi:hypothetical protein
MASLSSGGIEITKKNYLALRKAYRKAVSEKQEQFVFQKQTLLTDFAKYVLQYMETFPSIQPLMDKPD